VSYTVDLIPGPAESLSAVVDTAITVDLTTEVAEFATAAITLDLAGEPAGSITLDAELDQIVEESVVAGGITLDAHPGSVTTVTGTYGAITLEVDGCSGPPGPPGPAGDGGILRWHQAAAADVWTIPHGLGFYPAVSTTDTAGTQVYGNVLYPDENTVQVTFGLAFAGYANLS
jgi:hypothetical protein